MTVYSKLSSSARRATPATGAVLALALGSASAFGQVAEPPISQAEFQITRRAICTLHKQPIATAAEYAACERFIDKHRRPLNDRDNLAAIDAACFNRHKAHHISFYNSCRVQLSEKYNVSASLRPVLPQDPVVASAAPPPANTGSSTVAGSCAKGAAVGVGTAFLLQGGAFVADIFGCAGACSVLAAKFVVPSVVGQAALGCAGGVALHSVDALAGQSSDDVRRPLPPRPQTVAPR